METVEMVTRGQLPDCARDADRGSGAELNGLRSRQMAPCTPIYAAQSPESAEPRARLSGVVTQKNGSRAHHTAKPKQDERDLARQTAGVEMAA